MNLRDLRNNANALPINDIRKIKGGAGDPPPMWKPPIKLD